METEETTGGLGDRGGGYGHSGGGPYRVLAARAPPGTTGGGAAETEMAGTTEGLDDVGGGYGHPRPADWPQMTSRQRKHWHQRQRR